MSHALPQEFTVVLIATEMTLYPLCAPESSHLKAALPVAGRPMLDYSLELLERSGFEHVLVLASSTSVQQVNDLCANWLAAPLPPTPVDSSAFSSPSSSNAPSPASSSVSFLPSSMHQSSPSLTHLSSSSSTTTSSTTSSQQSNLLSPTNSSSSTLPSTSPTSTSSSALHSTSPGGSSLTPSSFFDPKRLKPIVFQVDPSLGTADMLLALKKKELLRGDFIVLSCDLILDWSSSLVKLVDSHRQKGASLTMLLHQLPPLDPTRRKQRIKEEESGSASHIDYIGLDPSQRVVLLHKSSDLNDGLCLSKKTIRRFPNLTVTNGILDAQCYIFAAAVGDLLVDAESSMKFRDIKSDLVPHLIRYQFRRQKPFSDAAGNAGGAGVQHLSQPAFPVVHRPQDYSHTLSMDDRRCAHQHKTSHATLSSSSSSSSSSSNSTSNSTSTSNLTSSLTSSSSSTTSNSTTTTTTTTSNTSQNASNDSILCSLSSSPSSSSSSSLLSSSAIPSSPPSPASLPAPAPFRCFAVVLQASVGCYCSKAITIQHYVDMNRDIAAGLSEYRPVQPEKGELRFVDPTATTERVAIGPGCVVGPGSALVGATLKRSLVGKDCHFSASKGLVIEGSVIMDNVVIQQGRAKVEIHGSVICSGAQILPGCTEIRNSVVGYNQVVSHNIKDTLFTQSS